MKEHDWAKSIIYEQSREGASFKESATQMLAEELRRQDGWLSEEALCAIEIALSGKPIDSRPAQSAMVQHALNALDQVVTKGDALSGFDMIAVDAIALQSTNVQVLNYAQNIRQLDEVASRYPVDGEKGVLASSLLRVAATRPGERVARRKQEIESLKAKGIFGEKAKQLTASLPKYKKVITVATPLVEELAKLNDIQRTLHVPAPKEQTHAPIMVHNNTENSGGIFVIAIVVVCSLLLGVIRASRSTGPRKPTVTAIELQGLLSAKTGIHPMGIQYSYGYYGKVLNAHLKGNTYQATVAHLYDQFKAFACRQRCEFTWTSLTTTLSNADILSDHAYQLLDLKAEAARLSQEGRSDAYVESTIGEKFDLWFQNLETKDGDTNTFDRSIPISDQLIQEEFAELNPQETDEVQEALKRLLNNE